MWIDAHEGEANGVLTLRLSQPAQRIHVIAEQAIDNCNLVGGDPFLLSSRQNLFENRPRFIVPADCGEQVCQLGARGGSVAGKTPLVFKRSEGFVMHSLLFVS